MCAQLYALHFLWLRVSNCTARWRLLLFLRQTDHRVQTALTLPVVSPGVIYKKGAVHPRTGHEGTEGE